MTDGAGVVKWSADYKPFGEVNITTNDITNNLRFPGQYYDAETGLIYNYRRDYNPIIGRYIESDPIGLKGGINLYAYVDNNPIRFTDPLGLYSWGDVTTAWDHYCDGSETPWSTSFSSINWGDARSRINTSIRSMIGGSCRNATIPVNIDVETQTAGADAAIISGTQSMLVVRFD
jgi:RHS repeat-associated protein